MADYKKCSQGHYYSASLNSCPYCTGSNQNVPGNNATNAYGSNGNAGAGNVAAGSKDPNKTTLVGGGFAGSNPAANNDPNKTTLIGGFAHPAAGETVNINNPKPGAPNSNHTEFWDETKKNENGEVVGQARTRRKLVGWLVSYTLDEMGVDFKLYEGKNMVGRDNACNITVADPLVSGQHCLILFRDGKFSIRDQQSTHGTFVNGNDIDLDAIHLHDNDLLRIGNTIFRFRTAL